MVLTHLNMRTYKIFPKKICYILMKIKRWEFSQMGYSALNYHLYKNHISVSSKCACGHSCEDELHYFFVCQLYNTQRTVLHNTIIEYAPFNLHTVLHGRQDLPVNVNHIIFQSVHKYIQDTSRFYWYFIVKL